MKQPEEPEFNKPQESGVRPGNVFPDVDTLCDHCANQPECNAHHQMCVSFEPKDGRVIPG